MAHLSYPELHRILKKHMLPGRLRHSVEVGRLAGELALRHGWDPEQAGLAGLAHDCARDWKAARLIRYARRHRLAVSCMSFIVRSNPLMLHDVVGADYAGRNGWITDRTTLRAIATHMMGSVPMTRAQKILYIADSASKDRQFEGTSDIRRSAMRNLDEGFRKAMSFKVRYQFVRGRPIHPLTVQVWNKVACRS